MSTSNLTSKLLIIGGGPGGYVAGIRAGQLGIDTILVEGGNLGGTCLNIGCIPSKALIHVAEEFHKAEQHAHGSALGISHSAPQLDLAKAVSWKDGIVGKLTGGVGALLKKNGVKVVKGQAHIVDGKHVRVTQADGAVVDIACEHLLLATGSLPVELPFMPFGGAVISSTEALSPTTLPQKLVVVGGGYIGLELGIAYRKLGVQVAVVESLPRILPAYDEELSKVVANSLKKLGIELHLGCRVEGMNSAGTAVRVLDAEHKEFELSADRVLVAVGRKPNTQGYGLESLMLDMSGRSIKIDDQCRTSMRNVWAIGDVTGEPMLAHRAMAQGEMVAEIISGKKRHFQPAAIPAVCFTDPELVVAGLSPQEAQAAGIDIITANFPFAANGRAMSIESTDGFVRVVARRDNRLIIGWQAVGAGVSELATAFGQSLEMGATLDDIGSTIHAHPTLGETVQEAALRALGHALHI
ncbi:dihydrolipoyl dehydrogenase [Massilia sp. W12]|uniref:dihydrolipoyl dehydrogenase n=1 Tax=Massilia sp. W12 TaxID=3126507 RepID=UPI0030CE6323